MKFLHTIINTSYDCTEKEPNRSPVFVFSKVVEEICELSDVFHGVHSSEPLDGEVADVIISVIDLLYVMDFNTTQVHGCMTKAEVIDSVINRMKLTNGCSEYLEEDWFRLADRTPEKHLLMITHYLGRLTRLLNQPQRSQDDLGMLINQIIMFAGRMACAEGALNSVNMASTRVKVEHTIEYKVQKWRGKFGL